MDDVIILNSYVEKIINHTVDKKVEYIQNMRPTNTNTV